MFKALLLAAALVSVLCAYSEAKVKCPPRDKPHCGHPQPDGFPKSLCNEYHNVKEDCPFMCGVCKGAQAPICNGLKCQNGGTLYEDNCKCECASKLITGKQCEKVSCPKKDKNGCGLPDPTGYPKKFCSVYSNIKDICPYMCGVCKGKQLCDGLNCMNGGKLNEKTCKCECPKLYQSPSCLKLTCPPHDRHVCGKPRPFGYPKNMCQYDNVKDDCPFMCGICKGKQQALCNGNKCQNGGVMDLDKCTCTCRNPKFISGKLCEIVKCPPHDKYICNRPQPYGYPKNMCKYDNVKEVCPFMCELCKGKQQPFCNGLKCENGGELNIPRCTCRCQAKFFSGKRCEISSCPPRDKLICGKPQPYGYPKTFCKYSNVQAVCPYMCEVCKGKQKPVCDGLTCLNGGTLDPSKCVCHCPKYHSGKRCEMVNCPKKDKPICGQPAPYGFPKSTCDKYINVPQDCPYMCGICKGKQQLPCDGLVCQNRGKLDEKKCACDCPKLYQGKKCEHLVCPKIDKNSCGLPKGQGYPESYCKKYSNVKYDCPFMCGVCKGKQLCDGKKCWNNGKLDVGSCKCQCRKIYKDDNCKTLNCPAHDHKACGKPAPYGMPKELCNKYINIREDCPFMCGICKGKQKFVCDGLECQNGGTLDAAKCTCSCRKHYTGKTCETLVCPKEDNPRCGVGRPYGFPTGTCKQYINVRDECPFMCGKCKGTPAVKNISKLRKQPVCAKKFSGTTICKYKDYVGMRPIGVDKKDAKLILDLHNELRRKANPTAANMQKMAYDETIAVYAQKWSNVCFDGHDKSSYRVMPELKIPMGQNWAHGYENWTAAIMGWHEEINFYKYGLPPRSYLGKRNWTEIAHYTLLMQDEASTFGCGVAMCPNLGLVHTCNYVFGNKADLAHPYIKGKTCSMCPNSCKNKLCDCGGKFCLNGAKLDIDKCVCKCPKIYVGSQCQTLTCPPRDRSFCGKPKAKGYPKESCTQFDNVKIECPYMCGVCKGKQKLICDGLTCQNNGKLDEKTCTCKCKRPFLGKSCEILKCPDMDKNICTQPAPKGYPESYCKTYDNVKEECPYMCGICKGKQKCDGLKCFHGGSLDKNTCKCKCTKLYKGPSCKIKNCPGQDPGYCNKDPPYGYPTTFCKFSNVRAECPYMCKQCKKGEEEEEKEKEE